jgi:hypothetical protein
MRVLHEQSHPGSYSCQVGRGGPHLLGLKGLQVRGAGRGVGLLLPAELVDAQGSMPGVNKLSSFLPMYSTRIVWWEPQHPPGSLVVSSLSDWIVELSSRCLCICTHCSISAWDAKDGKLVRTFKGHAHWVNTLALSSEHVLRTGEGAEA